MELVDLLESLPYFSHKNRVLFKITKHLADAKANLS